MMYWSKYNQRTAIFQGNKKFFQQKSFYFLPVKDIRQRLISFFILQLAKYSGGVILIDEYIVCNILF